MGLWGHLRGSSIHLDGVLPLGSGIYLDAVLPLLGRGAVLGSSGDRCGGRLARRLGWSQEAVGGLRIGWGSLWAVLGPAWSAFSVPLIAGLKFTEQCQSLEALQSVLEPTSGVLLRPERLLGRVGARALMGHLRRLLAPSAVLGASWAILGSLDCRRAAQGVEGGTQSGKGGGR